MKVGNFDTLPHLSQKEALRILKMPVEDLRISSDYYKAVFHLAKYPGSDTEDALLALVESKADEECIIIATRQKKQITSLYNQ